jgi:hypothetical protein
MIYKFQSNAAGDVILMASPGDELLRIIGKSPASTGIVQAASIGDAINAIERAIEAEEVARAKAENPAEREISEGQDEVTLSQRAWPLVEMMKRSMAEGADITWALWNDPLFG